MLILPAASTKSAEAIRQSGAHLRATSKKAEREKEEKEKAAEVKPILDEEQPRTISPVPFSDFRDDDYSTVEHLVEDTIPTEKAKDDKPLISFTIVVNLGCFF